MFCKNHYETCQTSQQWRPVDFSKLPGCEVMISVLLSSVWMVFLNPHRASASLMLIFIIKLSSCLWKTGWSFWSSTMITSPGSSPGSWSPSPWNVIFWPSFIPAKHIHFQFALKSTLSTLTTNYNYKIYLKWEKAYLCQYELQGFSSCAPLCVRCSTCTDPLSWIFRLVPGSLNTCFGFAESCQVQSVAPWLVLLFLCSWSISPRHLSYHHNL